MGICNDASSLIFFSFWDRRRLPAGRQGRPKHPIINDAPIIFLPILPTGKVADNQIREITIYATHWYHGAFIGWLTDELRSLILNH
jgi:hypothetical protein